MGGSVFFPKASWVQRGDSDHGAAWDRVPTGSPVRTWIRIVLDLWGVGTLIMSPYPIDEGGAFYTFFHKGLAYVFKVYF